MEKPHKKLEAWKQSMDLAIEVYGATKAFPSQEMYGLTNQIRRAAVSIPSNVAEGAARQTKKSLPITFISLRAPSVSWTHSSS
jgi:four helix bundle protein